MHVLILSRDSSGLKQDSSTANRWRLLRDQVVGLDIVVMSRQTGSWSEDGIRVWGSGGRALFQRLWRTRSMIMKLGLVCDLITAQDPFELGWLAMCVAKRFAKPFEIQDHGGFFDGEKVDEPLWFLRSRFAWWLARRAKMIRTVSPGSQSQLKSAGFEKKTYFLPIAANERFARANYHPDPNLIVTVSRLVSVKRVNVLIRAFFELRKIKPQMKLAIIGDGPKREVLQKLADRLGLGDAVQFVGESDPLPWLERTALFVSLSAHEGWGIASVEAAMVGVPVLMTDTGCARWLEGAGRALIATGTDPVSIARQLGEAQRLRIGSLPVDVRDGFETVVQQAREWNNLLSMKPRTLICAQAVDENDPLFGFFTPWLRSFSEYDDAIVCALRVSDPLPNFPQNIEVRATRQKGSRSKLLVLWNVACISWRERFRYQSVFIRGDAQYLACLGWLWRLLGKKIVFWYTHYTTRSPWFWLAAPWAHDVVTAVSESNPLASAVKIGHHIDTDRFHPVIQSRERKKPSILLFGRISPVKRVAWMVRLLAPYIASGSLDLRVVGKATDAVSREELIQAMPEAGIWEERDVSSAEAPDLYVQHDIFINATPGSMDKTILEAAASGLIVMAATQGFIRGLSKDLHWLQFEDERSCVDAVERAIALRPDQRKEIGLRLRSWVKQQHSMQSHITKLVSLFQEQTPYCPLKQRIKMMLKHCGIWRNPRGIPVVMFHAFDNRGCTGWDLVRLTAWLTRVVSSGYAFRDPSRKDVGFNQDEQHMEILVTIDDATEDLRAVLPIFQSFGVCPLVFVPTRCHEIVNIDGCRRRVMSLSELVTMEQEGLLVIGVHSRFHRSLTDIPTEEMTSEIVDALKDVQNATKTEIPRYFAYPRGKFNGRIQEIVKSVGYDGAFSVQMGIWSRESDLFAIPRIPVMWWMLSQDLLTMMRIK